MLTLILLVVLGGGVGLLAVSLSDHPAPWAARRERHGVPSLRPYPTGDTSPPDGAGSDTDEAGDPVADGFVVMGVATSDAAPADASAPPESGHAPTRRYRRVAPVPAARTAVEGPYEEIGVAPWWRRLVSLALIVVILCVVGAGIAVVLGAVIAAVAELLDSAIG